MFDFTVTVTFVVHAEPDGVGEATEAASKSAQEYANVLTNAGAENVTVQRID